MNISELLQSTHRVKNHAYGPKNTFNNKKYGELFLYNKVVRAKSGNSVIEVSMMIKAVTDNKETNYHRVMMAISGVNQRTVQGMTLVRELEAMDDKYKEMEYEDVIAHAIEGKPFPDKTVIKNEAGTYTIIDDNVSKDSMIKVWCSCSDYYWTWQYYNVENDVDIFKEANKYNPRTAKGKNALKTNHPLRNPNRRPGMCKHLLLLLALLMDPEGNGGSNVIKEARGVTRAYKANIERFKKADRLTSYQYGKIVQKWEEERKAIDRDRGVENDPVLQRKKKTNWRAVQRKMVG